MTITMPDRSDHQQVTDLPASELEKLIHAEPQRPCMAAAASPEEWFPVEPGSGNQTRARALHEALALALCRGCPVALECLELTLRREGLQRGHGIAGATTPLQRQRIKAGRGLAVRS